jgi:alanine racemase
MTGSTSRLTVDLDALVANYRRLVAAARPAATAAVVKADAYGLGLHPVARALLAAGCETFFVATAAEGIQLRHAAPHAEVFVFAGPMPDDLDLYVRHALTPVINRHDQLASWTAQRHRPIALQVDTGMNRLGLAPDLVPEAVAGFRVSLLLTHLACADEPENPLNAVQLDRFAGVSARFPGIRTSIANSAALLAGPRFRGDLCRPGIALYGGNPFIDRPNPMRAVASLEGRVLQLRRVDAGDSVGYGATHRADGERTLAVIGLGYADGLPRRLSNCGEVAIGGVRAPIVGRISMDLTTIDVTDLPCPVEVGTWVQFFGDGVGIDEVAARVGTISYELLTHLGRRLDRQYLAPDSSPLST